MDGARAGGTIGFTIRRSKARGVKKRQDAIQGEISGPDAGYWLIRGKPFACECSMALRRMLDDPPGVWTVKTSETYLHQTAVVTFNVTR